MPRFEAIFAVTLALPMLGSAPALAGSPFDGAWSVSIITNSGTCDRGYRYAIHIQDGRISYDDATVSVSGEVTPRGAVQVEVRAGQQEARGTGKMTPTSGEGTWSGESASGQCSGVWQADRDVHTIN